MVTRSSRGDCRPATSSIERRPTLFQTVTEWGTPWPRAKSRGTAEGGRFTRRSSGGHHPSVTVLNDQPATILGGQDREIYPPIFGGLGIEEKISSPFARCLTEEQPHIITYSLTGRTKESYLDIYRFWPEAKIGNGLEITPTSGSVFAENCPRLKSVNGRTLDPFIV